MAMDLKHTLERIATTLGKGLWIVLRHLCLLLAATAKFIVMRLIPATWRWLRGTAFPALRRFYLWLPHRRLVVGCTAAAIAIAVLLLRTPDPGSPVEPAYAVQEEAETPAEPAVLTFTPAQAAPGALLVLHGAPLAANESFDVLVGGQPAAAERLADGRIHVLVPLYLGPDGWPVPPDGAQTLEIRRHGTTVVAVGKGLAVTPLQRAPGTLESVQRSLVAITDGYERTFDALPVHDERERALRKGVIAMMRGLASDGDKSLAAVLAGASGHDRELTDALLASSGAAAYLEAYAASFGGNPALAGTGLAPPGAGAAFPALMMLPMPGGAPRCRGEGKDFEVACMMQVQGLLTDFSQYFVKPTAELYADTVGLVISAGAIGGLTIPLHTAISAILGVFNFIMDKIAPSLLPSTLDDFELKVSERLLDIDETTRATITLSAHNTPQTITFNDVVDLVKTIVGPLIPVKGDLQEAIKAAFEFAIDLYMAVLREMELVAKGSTDRVNPGVFKMPALTWGPLEVRSSDLVSLFATEGQVLAVEEDELAWRAIGYGSTNARIMPRVAGERSKVLVDDTLCIGCVWHGGAFGTDMPYDAEPIAVGVMLEASPQKGLAPMEVRLEWSLLPAEEGEAPPSCTLDFDDGSPPLKVPDCRETRSVKHTYQATSRLEASDGAFLPTLRVDGTRMQDSTEVFTDWSFDGSPETGQAPLDARFSWDIPWSPDRQPPRCEFDPGDGSPRQSFDDCLETTRTEHTFERRGSFAPTLTIIEGASRDTRTAPVSVAEEGTCDADLTRHKAWKGTVSYSQARDAWNKAGDANVKYTMDVRLGAEMHERTRREFRGAEYVQYYSPLPQGSGRIEYSFHGYGSDGKLEGSDTFSGSGPMQRQEKHMSEDGSMLTLTIDAHTCTYKFYLQGQTPGSGERWEWGKEPESYRGHRWIHSVWGQGLLSSSGSIRGSGSFPVLSRNQIEDNSLEKTDWVSEYDSVSGYLGEDNLGRVTVDWHFEPAD